MKTAAKCAERNVGEAGRISAGIAFEVVQQDRFPLRRGQTIDTLGYQPRELALLERLAGLRHRHLARLFQRDLCGSVARRHRGLAADDASKPGSEALGIAQFRERGQRITKRLGRHVFGRREVATIA